MNIVSKFRKSENPLVDFQEKKDKLVVLDYVVGLRVWGLILYGALPANLALLGMLDVTIGEVDKLFSYFIFIPVSILPLLLTFLLIRTRHKEWYLTTDFLNLRSAISTMLILVSASLISGASGIIHGKYASLHLTAIAESFLIGVGSLVITSTLFITVLTKNTNLPGLPSSSFVELLAGIRGKIRQIQASLIWKEYNPQGSDQMTKSVQSLANEIKNEFEKVDAHQGNKLAKQRLRHIRFDSKDLIEAVTEILGGGESVKLKEHRWKVYFAEFKDLSENQQVERGLKKDRYAAVQRLKMLSVGALYG